MGPSDARRSSGRHARGTPPPLGEARSRDRSGARRDWDARKQAGPRARQPRGPAPGTAQRRAARAGSRAPRARRGTAHRNGGEGRGGRPSSSPFIDQRGRERRELGLEGQERGAAASPAPAPALPMPRPCRPPRPPTSAAPASVCSSPPRTPPRRKLRAQLIESKARGKGPPRRGPPPPLLRAPFPALGGISSAATTTSL